MWLAAEEYVAEVDKLLPRLWVENPNAADHLKRSSESVLFNIGEGIGAYAPKVKIVSYEHGKKESNEGRAILRRVTRQRIFTPAETGKALELSGAIVGMLTAAIKAVSKRLSDDDAEDKDGRVPRGRKTQTRRG